MIRSWTALVVMSTALLWPDGERVRADPPANHPSQADVSAAAKRSARGLTMMEKHDYAGAIDEFEQAYQLDPQNAQLYNLGAAHQSNGDRDEAIDYYHRYLAAEPAGKLADEARWQLEKLEAGKAEQARREEDARQDREHAEALRVEEHLRSEATVARAVAMAARAEATAARAEAAAARERADRVERAPGNGQPCAAGERDCSMPPSSVDQGIVDDANAGRGWAMPTALTETAGTWTFSDFNLYVLSASYAATDRLTLGLTTMVPTGTGFRFGSLSGKLQLVRSWRVRVAAQSKLTYLQDPESAMADMVAIGDAGGAITLCIDAICSSHLSGYVGAGVTRSSRTSALLIGAGSLVLGLTTHFKLMLEFDKGVGGAVGNGYLGWYGLRYTSKAFSVEAGAVMPFDEAGRKWVGSGLPFVGLTYRSFGE